MKKLTYDVNLNDHSLVLNCKREDKSGGYLSRDIRTAELKYNTLATYIEEMKKELEEIMRLEDELNDLVGEK